MKILITGASGYIGCRLVKNAIVNNHHIIAASHKSYNKNLDWIYFDLGEKPSFQLPEPVDVIFHLAANTTNKDINEQYEIAAANELISASLECGAKFVFVSSQAAREDAPTSYGRVKWRIEQDVLKAKGVVVRLGQVYGGPERGLFGTLTNFVRRLPALPAFMPPPLVQPIHVDDCAAGLLKLVELDGVQSGVYCFASPQPISFTKFLRSIARHRVHRCKLFVPVPVALVRFMARLLGPKLSIKYGLNRLNSLVELPTMNTAADMEAIGLELRSLQSGMHRSGSDQRRRLIQEAYALLVYILKTKPHSDTVRRYVRMIEQLHEGVPMCLPSLMIRWPVFIALLDNQTLINSPQEGIFNWRIDAATLIAEASTQGAYRFLGAAQPVWRVTALVQMMAAVFSDLLWRILRLIIPSSLLRIS